MDYEKEIERIRWTCIAIIAFLVAIMIAVVLIFPPDHNSKRLPGEQFPVQNPGS